MKDMNELRELVDKFRSISPCKKLRIEVSSIFMIELERAIKDEAFVQDSIFEAKNYLEGKVVEPLKSIISHTNDNELDIQFVVIEPEEEINKHGRKRGLSFIKRITVIE